MAHEIKDKREAKDGSVCLHKRISLEGEDHQIFWPERNNCYLYSLWAMRIQARSKWGLGWDLSLANQYWLGIASEKLRPRKDLNLKKATVSHSLGHCESSYSTSYNWTLMTLEERVRLMTLHNSASLKFNSFAWKTSPFWCHWLSSRRKDEQEWWGRSWESMHHP